MTAIPTVTDLTHLPTWVPSRSYCAVVVPIQVAPPHPQVGCFSASSFIGWQHILANVFPSPDSIRLAYPEKPNEAELHIRHIIPELVFCSDAFVTVSLLIGMFVPSLKHFKWSDLNFNSHNVVAQSSEVIVMLPPMRGASGRLDEMRDLLTLCESDDAPWKGKPWLIYDHTYAGGQPTFDNLLRYQPPHAD